MEEPSEHQMWKGYIWTSWVCLKGWRKESDFPGYMTGTLIMLSQNRRGEAWESLKKQLAKRWGKARFKREAPSSTAIMKAKRWTVLDNNRNAMGLWGHQVCGLFVSWINSWICNISHYLYHFKFCQELEEGAAPSRYNGLVEAHRKEISGPHLFLR